MKSITSLLLVLCTFSAVNCYGSDEPPCNHESLNDAREAAEREKEHKHHHDR
jgi:hypothetical protein